MKTKLINTKLGYTTPGSAQAARTYAGKPIKTGKTIIKSNGKVKSVTYGPVNNYGKQTKTKVKTKGGLSF